MHLKFVAEGTGSNTKGLPEHASNARLEALKLTGAALQALKEQPVKCGPTVVRPRHRRMPHAADFDVCVCGGTLGIFIATALQVTRMRHFRP